MNIRTINTGVVIGTAFGKIVSSLVSDIIMPLIGLAVGSVDLKDLSVTLKAAEGENPAVVLTYGAFLQNVFDFILIAFSIFLAIKVIINIKNRLVTQEAAEAPAPEVPADVKLLTEIRDLLKDKK